MVDQPCLNLGVAAVRVRHSGLPLGVPGFPEPSTASDLVLLHSQLQTAGTTLTLDLVFQHFSTWLISPSPGPQCLAQYLVQSRDSAWAPRMDRWMEGWLGRCLYVCMCV